MKQLLPPANATFDFTAKTITFATTIPSTISHILHVTNITRGVIYYQPQAGTAYSGTYASPVLTLLCSTAGHADADKLEIFYDDNATTTGVTGTVAATQSGTWDEVGINDSGNSITTDWAGTAPPIGAGVEATALRVTLATDSTGVVSVDDNGAALTVDNGGTFAVQLAAQPGAASNANSQVTASTSAATLAVARSTRRRLLVKNTDTAITVYVGAATVTAGNGMPLLAGESAEFQSVILYQVISASGSPVVAIVDEYD